MENTIYKKELKSGFTFFQLLLSIFIVFWLNDGLFSFIAGNWWIKYAKIVVFGLWFIIAWGKDSKFITRFFKLSLPLIFFIFLVWVEKIVGAKDYLNYASVAINNAIYILVITALFSFYYPKREKKEKRILVYAWFLDIIICGIITLNEINDNPMISRFLTTEDPSLYIGKSVLPNGVLFFGHSYAFVFVIVALCSNLKKETNTHRVILTGLIIYIFYLVLKMQFAISFLLSALSLIISLYMAFFAKEKNSILIILLPGILALFYLFSGNIIDFVIRLLEDNYELVNKLNEVKAFLLAHDLSGTDIYSRFIRYADSFKSIFSTYFLGSLLMGVGEIGAHSELIDACAVYGVFPVCFLLCYFVRIYKIIKEQLSPQKQRFLKINFGIFLIVSIVNTSLWSSIMIPFLFIVPLIFSVTDNPTYE